MSAVLSLHTMQKKDKGRICVITFDERHESVPLKPTNVLTQKIQLSVTQHEHKPPKLLPHRLWVR